MPIYIYIYIFINTFFLCSIFIFLNLILFSLILIFFFLDNTGCNQDHSTLAFIDIFPMNGKAVDFIDIVDSIFYEKSNTLNRLLFRLSDGSDDFPGSEMNYQYISKVALRFLITLDHWIKQLHKSGIKKFSPKMIQFAHSTYLSLLLTNVHLKNWKNLLLLVYNLKGFFEGLQNEDHRALHTIIKDIINGAEVH